MTSSPVQSSSIGENLRTAICVLALIAERFQDVDKLLPQDERNDDQDASDGDTGFEDPAENPEITDVDKGVEEEIHLAKLRDEVLDRLAEMLARFKSEPGRRKGPPLGSKHVSSTMMVVYPQSLMVKFLCAKNEGLDQRGTTEDTAFLDSWRKCMECISKRGPEAEEAKVSLFTLVLDYQRPRINHYLKKLQDAFGAEKVPRRPLHPNQVKLSATTLQRIPCVRGRKWIVDQEEEFQIPTGSFAEVDAESEAAVSVDSFKNINDEVDALFHKVERIRHSDIANDPALPFTTAQRCLLKDLMVDTLDLWKSARHRSAIKSRLRNQFQQGPKAQTAAVVALTFLSRIYRGVLTFINAAEKMPVFQAIEFVSVNVPQTQFQRGTLRKTPMEMVKSLGIRVTGDRWVNYLERQTTKDSFHGLRQERSHAHAELQVLHHYDAMYASTNEGHQVHPYIGCSKRCCLLCYCFIRAYGGFKVRGTHETIMNRWEIPTVASAANSHAEFRSATQHLFNIVVAILRDLLQKPYPTTRVELLAQSSAAMSTAQTILDRDTSQMEKSQLIMRRMMMTPTVMNDAVHVSEIPEKPGYAYVVGGTLGINGREMSLSEAEVFKENHIRSKLGLEKQAEMPPRQQSAPWTCKRCRSPSTLRCSACRTNYCSRRCQRKDWKAHVFICTVRNRPNDFDRLRIMLSQGLCMSRDGAASSKFLVDLFSDDHLCKCFGFVNCFNCDEVAMLLCLYGHVIHTFKSHINWIGTGNLGDFLEAWATDQANNKHVSSGCHCTSWFLFRRGTGFNIPNWEGQYVYQTIGIRVAESAFSLRPAAEDPTPLVPAEAAVLFLYTRLFRPFNNLPDIDSSEWTDFGFCFSKNHDQSKSLAEAYLDLARSGASLREIADAWESSSLPRLIQSRGIHLSFLETNGGLLQCPDAEEFGIYRLIAEVSHILSGRLCACFGPKGYCHPKYEILSRESDGDYGFHGTNAWERWQLLNFYKHVFQLPEFDACKMQRARRDADPETLERYLDSLVPDFRRKIGNPYLADAFFPKLKARVRFPHGRPHCYCVVHNVVAPEGLDWRVGWGIWKILGRRPFQGDEGEELNELEEID